jgi:hypothetical protein
MPLYTPILMTVGKKLTELIIDAVIEKALGKKKDASNAVDKIHELAMTQAEFSQQVLRGQMRDKAGLMKIINELHRENRASLRQIVMFCPSVLSHFRNNVGNAEGATMSKPLVRHTFETHHQLLPQFNRLPFS